MSRRNNGWDDDAEYDAESNPEEYERYYEDDDEPRPRRTLMLLGIVALVVLFGSVLLLAYSGGDAKAPNGKPPVLRADGEPIKEVPENPGGKTFPHQDAGVYNRLAGESRSANSANRGDSEQLLPPAEEPITIDNQTPSEADRNALDRMAQAIESSPLPSDTLPPVTEPSTSDSSPVVEQPAPATAATRSSTPEPAANAVGSGGYVVQLAAFRDEPAARDSFRKLQVKYPDLLGSLGVDIQRADLGDKGIYYRLRAGYLDKQGADRICAQLESKGQGCLVRPR